jgi:hypothetical protein
MGVAPWLTNRKCRDPHGEEKRTGAALSSVGPTGKPYLLLPLRGKHQRIPMQKFPT